MPWEYLRWELVDETGWTLDVIDALSVNDFAEWIQVRDGKAKAKRSLAERHK